MKECARVATPRKPVAFSDEFDESIEDNIGLHNANFVDSRLPQSHERKSLNSRMASFEKLSTYIVDSRTIDVRGTDQDDVLQDSINIYPCTQACAAVDCQPAAKYFVAEGGGNIGHKQSDHTKQPPKLHTSFNHKKSDYLLEQITTARKLNDPASPAEVENQLRLTSPPIQRPKIAQQYSSRPWTSTGPDLPMSRPKTSKPSTAMGSYRRDNKSRRQSRPYKEVVCSTDHRYDFIQSRKLVGCKMPPHSSDVKALNPKHIIYREFSYNPEEMAILDYCLNNIIYLESDHGHAEASYSNQNNQEEIPSELFRYQFQPFLPLSMKLKRALKAPRSPSELKKIDLTYMVDKANTMLSKFPVVEDVDDSFNVSDGNASAVESKYTIYHTLDRMHRPSRYTSHAAVIEEKDFIDMVASPAIARRPSSSSTGHAAKLDSTVIARRTSCPNDDDDYDDVAVGTTRIQSICSSEQQKVAAPVTSSPLANRKLKVVVKLESTHCYNTYDDLQLDQMINHAADMVDSMSCRLID